MRSEAGTFLSIALPLVTGGEEQPRFSRFVPQRMVTQRIVGEREDFLFMLIEPRDPFFEGNLVPLPETVGNVDLQPVRAALSQLFAHPEFEQRSSPVVRLRMDQFRHGICARAMVKLPGKIETLFRKQL